MKHFFYNGVEYATLPDPFNGVSPMTDARFVALGGEIREAEHLTPKERVCQEFADLIEDLASKTDKITPEEFLAAAQNGISADLIDFARERGIPEDVITEGRTRIIEIKADADRFGMTWAKLVNGATGA